MNNPLRLPQAILRPFPWLLAVAVCLAAAAAGRADALDHALSRHAQPILNELYKRPCQTVGVLRFRYQRGDGEPTFYAGAINQNLADRLENALILANSVDDPADPIGILRNAGAAKDVGAWYEDLDERRKLFKLDGYTPAWKEGPPWKDGPVKPEGFLTGSIRVADDLQSATVTVELFTPDHLELAPVCTFEVRTDTSLLRDLGQTFAVPEHDLAPAERVARAIEDVRLRRELGKGAEISPENTCGLRLEIYYDNRPQEVKKDPANGGLWYVLPPRPGEKVRLVLSHRGKPAVRLGALLRVNGLSTIEKQEGDMRSCDLWLLNPPEEKQSFEGFYMADKGNKVREFEVLDDAASAQRAQESGAKVGLIELDVFESRPEEVREERPPLTLVGLTQAELEAKPAQTLVALQKRLADARHPTLGRAGDGSRNRGGGLIVPGGTLKEAGPIQTDKFPARVHVGGIVIRYYNPQTIKKQKIKISN
jgi:hypothetical protein